MTKKFRLTSKSKEVYGIKLYQIEYLKDFADIKKGELGGWLEKEDNLSQEGNALVSGDARVSGNAWVYGDARVSGNAWVYGDAWVYGNAWVSGNALVYKQKLIGGYFYHTKSKSEKIETCETYDDGCETLCSNPKFEEEEKPAGKKVKIRLANDQIVEGFLEEDN